MSEQIDMFNLIPKSIGPGCITEDVSDLGRELTWEEVEAKVGELIWFERRGESYLYWEVWQPESFHDDCYYYKDENGEWTEMPSRRGVFYTGTKQRSYTSKYYEEKFYAVKH